MTRRENLNDWIARKKAKGVWRQPKPNLWESKTVLTGYCPCDNCDHEYMLLCDPDYNDCQCCPEVCS